MKNNALLILCLSFTVLFSSCLQENVRPSGDITTISYDLAGFDGIEASHSFDVYVTFSDGGDAVEIEANDNLHDEMVIEKVANKLVIRLKNNTNIRGTAKLKAYITTSQSTDFAGSGATDFIFQNQLDASQIKVSLSGASSLTGDLLSNHIKADLSGASELEISGTTQSLNIEASGASSMENYGLSTNQVDADLSGASSVQLTVNELLNVEASGASNLYYKGDGLIDKLSISGGSKVSKR